MKAIHIMRHLLGECESRDLIREANDGNSERLLADSATIALRTVTGRPGEQPERAAVYGMS